MREMISLGYNMFVEKEFLDDLNNEEVRRLPLFCSPEDNEGVWYYNLYQKKEKVREDWMRKFEGRIRKNGNSYFVDITDFGRYPDDRPEIVRVILEKRDIYTVVKSCKFL